MVIATHARRPGPIGGGASRITFNAAGSITGAGRILSGTNNNCAGGKTPWNTWLSCEEVNLGRVFETYPLGGTAVARPAMGRFKHEAAAADPVRRVVYLTEDETNGKLYRFVPTTWGDLSAGTLQVLVAARHVRLLQRRHHVLRDRAVPDVSRRWAVLV